MRISNRTGKYYHVSYCLYYEGLRFIWTFFLCCNLDFEVCLDPRMENLSTASGQDVRSFLGFSTAIGFVNGNGRLLEINR